MRDQLIRAHALCKLLDLFDAEIEIATEEREDLYQTIADVSQDSPAERVYSNQIREGLDNRVSETLVNLRDKLNISVYYVNMLQQLRNSIELCSIDRFQTLMRKAVEDASEPDPPF